MPSRGFTPKRESLAKHSDVLAQTCLRRGMVPTTCVAAAAILLIIAGSSVTFASASIDSAKQTTATKSNTASAVGNTNVHHHHEDTAKVKACGKNKAPNKPSITTTTRRRAEEENNCAVCDAFAEELERAIRYATSTDPLTMQTYLVRLLQRYVMFWHPHYFLRRIIKAVYFILSGAPDEALRTVRESADLLELDLRLSYGQGIPSSGEKEVDFTFGSGVGHEDSRGVIERARRGLLYQNEGSLTSTGVAFAKWDAGAALTVDEVLAAEERGNGFPWVKAREGSNGRGRGGGGDAAKMAGGTSRNKYLGVVDHQVYDPTYFSGAAAGRQVIPLGASAFTALALQEESSRALEKRLLPSNNKKSTKKEKNKKHTTAQSAVVDDDYVIVVDEDEKGYPPQDDNEGDEEEEDVYAFHFAEVQPELCIAYNNTASHYAFEEEEEERGKVDEGELQGALVLVERSAASSDSTAKAAMAVRRDMNFGYAGRRLPPSTATYHQRQSNTEIKQSKKGGAGEEPPSGGRPQVYKRRSMRLEGSTLTHVDPLVALSLTEMYPLGFVWVVENSDAHGVPLPTKDTGEGVVDDWGDLQDEERGGATPSSFVRSFFNTVFSWVFSSSTIISSPDGNNQNNNDMINKNNEPFIALTSPPSRAQLGRCFVPIPTKKGMSRALALRKAEGERGIKRKAGTDRHGGQPASFSSLPSSPSHIPNQQHDTLFSSVPAASSLALAIASVSRSVSLEYIDAACLLAVTLSSSSVSPPVSLSLPPSLEEYSPLALITIESNPSPHLEEIESKKEESKPNSPRPSDALFVHKTKSSARQVQAVAMTIAAARLPQRLALSTALTSPTALMLALEQIAKADALVATSRELIAVNLHQGAASVALGGSEESQLHRGEGDDPNGKDPLFTDKAVESRGLVSWMMSLASSIVSPPTPPSLIGVFSSSRASEASLALVLALPREVFTLSMCPSKKSQLFYSSIHAARQQDQNKPSSASVTVTADNSVAVSAARTNLFRSSSPVSDSLAVRPSDVAFFTHSSIPRSVGGDIAFSYWFTMITTETQEVSADASTRSSHQPSNALEAHFKAFFEVYFGHSVALFNELAEGAADHYLQVSVNQAPGFVAKDIKHQDNGDHKSKTEKPDESGAVKKKSENHSPRKAVRRAILRAAVKKMKKSGRELHKTNVKKGEGRKKQGDLHAEL